MHGEAKMTVGMEKISSYESVPYESHPYRQSHPDRLSTIATLFGMVPPPLDSCRVLELGCCSGGNLIPFAEQFPNSRCVGVDRTCDRIKEGQALIDLCGLKNVELLQRDILQIGPELGEFDYIIAHGVYSWIPREVQDKLLSICADHLAPRGVAYVSYNTLPGWHLRGMIRDMMCYRTRSIESPADQLPQARALIDFLAQSVPSQDNAYGMVLKSELGILGEKDSYLIHEHLETFNSPLYFHEFVERAVASGLQYLGESNFRMMAIENFPRPVQGMLRSISSNLIELEQYMDFVRNRMFRETLLCHRNVVLDRTMSPERVTGLRIASNAQRIAAAVDNNSPEKTTFRCGASILATSDSLVIAAMQYLAESWPNSVPFPTLFATAQSRINSESVVSDTVRMAGESQRLAKVMLQCYATSQIEMSVSRPAFSREVVDLPEVSVVARAQAKSSNTVTNLQHEGVKLSDSQRHLVSILDGTRDKLSVLAHLCELVEKGTMLIREGGEKIFNRDRIKEVLSQLLHKDLAYLGRNALLKSPVTRSRPPSPPLLKGVHWLQAGQTRINSVPS